MAHPNQDGPRVNKAAIDEELNISLERLRTDYVELYALHRDDPNVPCWRNLRNPKCTC